MLLQPLKLFSQQKAAKPMETLSRWAALLEVCENLPRGWWQMKDNAVFQISHPQNTNMETISHTGSHGASLCCKRRCRKCQTQPPAETQGCQDGPGTNRVDEWGDGSPFLKVYVHAANF
jgi:hypothetical protein